MSGLAEIIQILQSGGPWAISAIFIAGWWIERKRADKERIVNEEMADAILDLSRAQTEAIAKMESSIIKISDFLQWTMRGD